MAHGFIERFCKTYRTQKNKAILFSQHIDSPCLAGAICVDFRSLVPARGIPRTKRSPNPKTAQKAAAASKERCVESPAGCRCRPRRPRKGDLASAVLLFPGSLK